MCWIQRELPRDLDTHKIYKQKESMVQNDSTFSSIPLSRELQENGCYWYRIRFRKMVLKITPAPTALLNVSDLVHSDIASNHANSVSTWLEKFNSKLQ